MIGVNWTVADWAATFLGEPMAFNRCDISHSTFIGLSIREIKIIDCKAFNVDFREADLSLADFSGTDLTESIFMNSNLSEATFLRARNYDINPGKNNLTQAKFSLPEAISLLYSLEIEIGGLEEQGHDLENADRPPADTQRKSND
jgi:fluoroquinolone resistance protein